MRSLSIGATGMLAQQLNVEVISHNIANMNTTSYQRRRAGSDSSDASTTVPVGVQVGLGVKTAAVYRITEQGNLTLTENPLDVAINGEGYFRITLPSGDTAYSRAGSFQLDGDGDVVTVDGFTVQPGLTVPPNAVDISVNASGEVLVSLDGVTAPSNIGQLELARFPNDARSEERRVGKECRSCWPSGTTCFWKHRHRVAQQWLPLERPDLARSNRASWKRRT